MTAITGHRRTFFHLLASTLLVTVLINEGARDRANGLVGTTSGTSFLVTSVISGILVEIDGMFWVLLPALVVLVLALVHLAFVPVPAPAVAAPADEERRVDLRGTIRVVAEVPSSWSSRS